ncbi:MAG: hypothetical protein EA411_12930 [Saprospirales bacterium]|nr:MAG: hypothetical protein EA411_12930 [Saprospirales bacterium]
MANIKYPMKKRRKRKKRVSWLSKKSKLGRFLSHISKINADYDDKLNWRRRFYILIGASAIVLFSLSSFQGVNADERYMTTYSHLSLDFYTSLGDYSVYDEWNNWETMRYNGVAFVLPFGILCEILNLDETDRGFHILRHFLLSILGVFILLFAGLISKSLFNWRAAFIAALILIVSPRFLGHTMINPRDIPFAFGFIGSVYFILLILKNIQIPNNKHLIGLALLMGYALSIRAGGALMLFLFLPAFYVTLLLLNYIKKGGQLPSLTNILKALGIPLGGGFLFGIALWPYALSSPFRVIADTFDRVTFFPVSIRILFDGDLITSTEVPTVYLPTWISITIPIVFILGIILLIPFFTKIFKKGPTYLILALCAMFIGPLLYVMLGDTALYDGWRHFTFFYVTGVPLAALGWEALSQWIEEKNWKPWIGPVILGLVMVEPAVHIMRNYQYPYVYFNPLIGGVSGAFGNYELDYWGISTRQGVEALEKKGVLHADMEPIVLATNFRYSVQNWLGSEYRDKVQVEYVRYRERYDTEWDYAIWISRFMDGSHMKAVDWPSSTRTFHTIKVNNTPISAVYEKGEPHAFEGKKALDQGQIQDAIQHFEREIEYNPKNNIAHLYLGMSVARSGDWEAALRHFETSLKYAPENQATVLNYAMAKINLGDYSDAKLALHEMVETFPNSHGGWYYLALANFREGELSLAAQYIQHTVQVRPDFRPGWQLGIQIFEEMGDQQRADLFRNRLEQL